ncbi:hypothetical protein COV20_01155 [Candidatus Woesearchaeota archaeon CG10_big_fil_rev_8_21_14_0_10_45_16]|nr:MAG: hypothetical protein COV20_01155 [Candidatus Woesearchaeota archaeon CG10_big_fil_rev_8_21_14_0_10_45_16]
MIKIHGNRMSGNSLKVEWVAKLVKAEYTFDEKDFKTDLKTADFLKLNPVGKIPVVEDGDFVLFESGAICKYLCDTQSSDLYPKDLKQRALVDQWIDFSTIHVGGAMSKVAFNKVFAPKMGVPVDEQSMADGIKFLARYLPVVEEQLGKGQFLMGDSLTLADITLLASLHYAEPAEVDLSPYQKITAWRNRLREMDFFKN